MDIQSKREKEKQLVSTMIHLYCQKKHHSKDQLCPQCDALNTYANKRSDHCPFMEEKTFCSNCKVHCYKADMREEIRTVMRFSAPRMLLIHPVVTTRHLLETIKEKKRIKVTK